MSTLISICQTLETKIQNEASFDKILIDYLVLMTSEKVDICKYARDPYLKQFIQLAFQPFLRLNPNSNSQFLSNLLEIIAFFKQLFIIHPAFLDCAASVLPIDIVLQTVLSTNNNELMRGVVEFLAHIASSPSLLITSASSAKSISDNILSMINVPVLSGYAIVILSGLIRFSTIFATAIKSSTELRRYRNILSNALSCDDHISVVGAISALLSLFPRSVDLETSKVAALHAITVSNDNTLLLKAATWIFIEVARENSITSPDFQSLLKIATTTVGWKAFCLFETLNCVLANSDASALVKDINIQKICGFTLSARYGYVAYSAVRFIQQLAENNESLFNQLIDCESITIKALEIASAPSLSVDIDLIECAIVLLRYIASSKVCFEKIKNVLNINEENVFVAFQRSIESNRSFTSLEFFLFLADVAKSFPDWGKRLRLIVIDTQFGALLAHILEKSTDRQTICDGIRAISLISNFSQESNINDGELLFVCIVSGFAVVNLQNKKDARIYKATTSDQLAKHEEDIFSLRNELEINQLELQSMKTQSEAANKRCKEAEMQANELSTRNIELENELAKLKEELSNKQKAFDDLTNQHNALNNDFAHQKINREKDTEKIKEMNLQIQKYIELEKEKSQIDRDNAKYETTIDSMQSTIDQLNSKITELTNGINNYKNKMKESKNQLSAQNAAIQKCEAEKEKMTIQLNNLLEKSNNFDKIHDSEKEKYALQKTKVRELTKTIESLRGQSNDLRSQLDAAEQKITELTQQITVLITERKQWELVTQFVHRITDENPVPSEQLMTLFNEV
ncbi:hypothetical protein TRFO_30408 [Tritrichomonas foetus]|uniref:Uncharacterized protein n=1 Tax=Tritrichomonas foetus TaxID=1144522 RepID=A0A1J4JTL9_9EUKA|nr:hypothetical protein TRFO_30408 [Tritrichomonas foetus]|eukprot:OHT02463.1 hypothetical protein TRFO_30408 [Tritrichomonas foetus]